MQKPALALYQPDIPQNTGTILRTAACLDVPVSVIGPTGFDMSDRALRRASLDYLPHVLITRFDDWSSFDIVRINKHQRIILASTHGGSPIHEFKFKINDIILMGRESAGVPETVRKAADAIVSIPVRAPLRSLNVAVAAGMMLFEALRQTSGFPPSPPA